MSCCCERHCRCREPRGLVTLDTGQSIVVEPPRDEPPKPDTTEETS